jgi:hypothetical protein
MRTLVELGDELTRRLRAADVVLAGLADDMNAAGASSAGERTERARADLQAAQELVQELLQRQSAED